MKFTAVAIALGSNLGDSKTIVETALYLLNNTPNIQVKTCSSWYQTPPIGSPQPDYINGCAILEVQLQPDTLLETLLAVETKLGRVRRERWGPRILDLDLLLFDNLIWETPTLKIPHPEMRERAFVLVPLAEIAPNWVDPVTKKTITQLLETVNCSGIRKL
ncbi:MAG TPA: 2-amino-4-hydroxy-6-hydroxymethyldihydropteridine diphosphokinase [Planktothrix sp. UBA8407]|jgi:2-amino-4-hydroxy-6-hydroxymethyldihydropteridine pyrophosphokinase|nr:2-amino-4-hydroxy-6-hydroxymethyldihydropteridine diphosphokinase [Planktothrix sp. UBA8407]HBK23874.1 2-amino-4-hydroxy-6-hydroxymethyldihydropteridine diphosphokinase [Planktothrix sp. UBA10369]